MASTVPDLSVVKNNNAAKAKPRSKREEVLDIASECFLSNGFDGTSINVMARDAGISKESIYRYFGSKEDLFKEVIERELKVYQQGMQNTASDYRGQSLEEALYHVAEEAMRLLTDDRAMALRRLIFQLVASGGAKIGKHYYLMGPQVAYDNLQKVFRHHLPEESIPCGPEKLSEYFLGMVLHHSMLERECGLLPKLSRKEVQRRCQEVVDNFIQAFNLPRQGQ